VVGVWPDALEGVVVVVVEPPAADADGPGDDPDEDELGVEPDAADEDGAPVTADAACGVVPVATTSPSPMADAVAAAPIRTVPRRTRARARSRAWPRIWLGALT
jgi:hypothetical protein